MKIINWIVALVGSIALVSHSFGQDHGHLEIGAASTNQNAPLIFANGSIFATESSYIKTLNYTNSGRYAGFYEGNITLTVRAATQDYAGPEADHPALGAHVYAQIVSVEGPTGGVLGWWEALANSPTISVLTGTTSSNTFRVSSTDGSPLADPFGHIHGRRFTATLPGIYKVTFKAFDVSTNGVGGDPIHTPSAPVTIYFQAGINIASIERNGTTSEVRFGSVANRTFALEYKDFLSGTNWTQTGNEVVGNDLLQSLTDTNANPTRFYRIKRF